MPTLQEVRFRVVTGRKIRDDFAAHFCPLSMSSRFLSSVFASALLAALPAIGRADVVEDLRPFLKAHCIECHGPEKEKGDVRLDGVIDEETLASVFDVIDVRDMPPKKATSHPSDDERQQTLDLLGAHLAASAERPLALRRLNRAEYENTIHDLLGITLT